MGHYLSKRQREQEKALEAEIVRQEWLAKRRMGKPVSDKPQWKIDRDALNEEFKAAGSRAMEAVIDVTKLIWPIVYKSYSDVVKAHKPVFESLAERLRANQRARMAWECEQDRAKDDNKDPGRTGQDAARKPARPDAAQFAANYHDPNR
jgi:hypothetical protein